MNTRKASAWTGWLLTAAWFAVFVLTALCISTARVSACAYANCATYPQPFVIPCKSFYDPATGLGPYCGSGYWGSPYHACCGVGSSGCCDYTCNTIYCNPYPPLSGCPQATLCNSGGKSAPAYCYVYTHSCGYSPPYP